MENEKTFSQEEVNNIVQERLAKEKAKYEKLLEEQKAEYDKRERLYQAKDELNKRGIPAELASLVKLDDEAAYNDSISLLEKNYKTVHPSEPLVRGVTPENRGRSTKSTGFSGSDPIKKAMGL